jgi:sigma-B regulation protein RsbU (phosphoserine phosphatase)
VIVIANTGTLPEAVRHNLFAPFVRSTDRSGGTGLGLFIVDQIARGHGGQVTADSHDGRTAFTVRLPRVTPGSRS